MKKRILSGMRPTGPLHIGHLFGALQNWIKLQDTYECLFMVADWHALMSEYEQPDDIQKNIIDMVADWVSCGLDPKRCAIFIQSRVPEHLELAMVLSDITPLSWLERNPTYKEQLREMKTRNLTTYGFLGYPVLQAADILLYKAGTVPVGEDQLAHLELTREIVRRFDKLYKKKILVEPHPLLAKTPRILGLDNRKMSKSYGNYIALKDEPDVIKKKVGSMITDPKRIRKTDKGHPDVCNVYSYYQIFIPSMRQEVCNWCTKAQKGCTECKARLASVIIDYLKPMREKRKKLVNNKDEAAGILREGTEKARSIASDTIAQIKKAVGMAQSETS
ncbi:tryptophan--tRNA ligase [Omnitrophica bacterium]|nr:tryptophan--tRNA ligase [Candidatus Omnitrophota bacterium]